MNGAVAEVMLDRPAKKNALSPELFEALIATGSELAARDEVRAVVLHGAGGTFCAGIDTSTFSNPELAAGTAGRLAPMPGSAANFYQRAATIWREVPVPVIAAVDGVAFGAGLQVAMGADIRIAAPEARLSVMEIRWGIIPDMALTVTMRHCVRLDVLIELACSGRIVSAREALPMGLVTRLDADPLCAARALAKDIAGRSPHAVRAAKALLTSGFGEPPDEALAREARLQATLLGTANQREAVISNMEKREPRFDDFVSGST